MAGQWISKNYFAYLSNWFESACAISQDKQTSDLYGSDHVATSFLLPAHVPEHLFAVRRALNWLSNGMDKTSHSAPHASPACYHLVT